MLLPLTFHRNQVKLNFSSGCKYDDYYSKSNVEEYILFSCT